MTRILVIEDERLLREEAVELLTLEGYDVSEAPDGQHGLELALTTSPDLILCDVGMPEMDGYKVLSALRAQPKTQTTPFIFLTAMADRSFMRHGMELGANDYLTKPYTRAELLAAVRTQLEKREAVEQVAQAQQEQVRRSVMRMVTHELRSPLAGMNLAQQLMERQLDHLSKADLRELLKTMRTGSHRLQTVVDQILLATQLESHMINEETVDSEGVYTEPHAVLTSAINQARRVAYRNQNADIRLDNYTMGAQVFGCVRVLVHAFAEIITNAINFSPNDQPVTIAVWLADDNIWISIHDHGPGIPAEKLTQAFQPFQQINRDLHEQQGIGLGLALAYRILTLHGGVMEINCAAGKGTEVVIGLPGYMSEAEA